MPWKETCAMKERLQLVSMYETGRYTVTKLAEYFGVSRKTAYKWLGLFAQGTAKTHIGSLIVGATVARSEEGRCDGTVRF
ncbi:MAG: helix-turn-helix domain-containing protein [Chloroflexi bacterium]|nr:helix-turn-helix domain-containing protein [Chloroflexota bacterium]